VTSAPGFDAAYWDPLWQQVPAFAGLADAVQQALSEAAHGDLPRWRAALTALPDGGDVTWSSDGPIRLTGSLTEQQQLRDALRQLMPWRKGPWSLFGVDIDSEWRSDWKWQRIAPHLDVLAGRRVLDVGCGNGYFGWRLLDAGAANVVGVDPTVLFVMQHLAIRRYLPAARHWVLPLRFEDLPAEPFDTVLSLGVVYHRRDPLAHVEALARCLRPGGQLVLESLVVEQGAPLLPAAEPGGRYARMRNVWCVPTPALLQAWLRRAGLVDVALLDVTPTTTAEQRRTDWMVFDSLAEALDPADPARTREGHPAPVRAVVGARLPG